MYVPQIVLALLSVQIHIDYRFQWTVRDGHSNDDGTLKFANGDTLTGAFLDNRFEGQGISTDSDGTK